MLIAKFLRGVPNIKNQDDHKRVKILNYILATLQEIQEDLHGMHKILNKNHTLMAAKVDKYQTSIEEIKNNSDDQELIQYELAFNMLR